MTNQTGLPWCRNNTTSMPPKPLEQAVSDAVCLNKILTYFFGDEKKDLKGFPSRARELPTMLSTYGLLPTLTFLLSKSDKNQDLKDAIELVANENNSGQDEDGEDREKKLNTLKNEFTKEGKGYALALYLLMRYLVHLVPSLMATFQGENDSSNYNTEALLEAIETLLEMSERGELTRTSTQLIEYSVELKKLVQGIVGEEE